MPTPAIRVLLSTLLMVVASLGLGSQELVDRVVARVENDVILLSDVRVLSRYQQFVDGESESDDQILDRLIDQWIVRTEAEVARSPRPSEADIEKSLNRLRSSFPSSEPQAIEDFYRHAVIPRAKARGQEPPTLEAARDFILEALVQQGINEQAERWLKESRQRLHLENLLAAGAK